MKIALSIILVIVAVLVSGCTSAVPSQPAAPVTPTLTGTWTGTMAGYDQGTGYTDYGNTTMSMVVAEQHGRLFSGTFLYRFNSTVQTVHMAGIIGSDGRTLAVVEEGNGYTTGEITGDTIQLSYLDNSLPISVDIDTLKRV